jgi:hypothetical protein
MNERYSFTFLRDPIERVLSFYYFCKTRDPDEYEIHRLCRESSLDEFLRIAIERPEVKSLVWNNQVWQLACGFGNPQYLDSSFFAPDELLGLAIRHLDDFSYVGFTETFDEDREKILLDLGVSSPRANFTSNSTPRRPTSKNLPRSTLELLGQFTQLDQALYQKAWERGGKKTLKLHEIAIDAPDIPLETNIIVTHDRADTSQATGDELQQVQNAYLELMQSCLTGSIYRDASQAPFAPHAFNPDLRERGLDWPAHAQTMIGVKRLANLRALTEAVIAEDVQGDLIETGVWRGGACILMRAILYAYNISERSVWVADSFEGLPPANEQQYPADTGSEFHKYKELAVTLEQVQDNFRAYGLLDGQTKFLKGWFKDTLPCAPINRLALMRLDGDMYESTMDALTSLYPRLSPGGYVIIDDYHVVPACKEAVEDFCASNQMQPEIKEIDGVGVYWQKPRTATPKDESARLNRGIESPGKQVSQLHRSISELSLNVIRQLEHCLAERDEQINRLSQAISAQNTAIAERNQIIAERDMQLAYSDRKTVEANDKLQAILSSTSWKVTSPMRAIKKLINDARDRVID